MKLQSLRRLLAAVAFLVISAVSANASMIIGSLGLNGFAPTQTAADLSSLVNVISTTNVTLNGSATGDYSMATLSASYGSPTSLSVATVLTGGGFTFSSAVNGTFVATSGVILTQSTTNLDLFLLGNYSPGTAFSTSSCNICTATGTLAHVSINQTGTSLSYAMTLMSPASNLPGVPEPATMGLLGSALVVLGLIGRKRLAR
jgi:hypothetical protein